LEETPAVLCLASLLSSNSNSNVQAASLLDKATMRPLLLLLDNKVKQNQLALVALVRAQVQHLQQIRDSGGLGLPKTTKHNPLRHLSVVEERHLVLSLLDHFLDSRSNSHHLDNQLRQAVCLAEEDWVRLKWHRCLRKARPIHLMI
jgi:hypothetical protein